MYRDEVTVPRCRKFIGDVVSTCGRCVSRFACLSVRQRFIQVSENRRGAGGLGDLVTPEWLGTMRRAAGETKVTGLTNRALQAIWASETCSDVKEKRRKL